ncbi:MAG: hypothetical protein ACRBFS_04295 [Aureispira sp.]
MLRLFSALVLTTLFFIACDKPTITPEEEPQLVFKLQLDPTQDRLNALAQPAPVPTGNAGQNPDFNKFSAHKIELVPTLFTPVNDGAIVYRGEETNTGGNNAVNFDKAILAGNGETMISVPIRDIAAGTYQHIRVSVSYQNYDIRFNINNIPLGNGQTSDLRQQKGTVASFLGFNNYISSVQPKTMTQAVNANKLQGYWAFETSLDAPYSTFNSIYVGEAATTTVVNPLNASAPTPPGSCLVTGSFDNNGLVITGNETEDVVVNLSFSTNKSFEWKDDNGNGELDIDLSNNSIETIVDMGLRGLQPSVQ